MINNYKVYLALITVVASLGGLLFGFDMAVISGVLPFVQKQFNLTPLQEGWFVSSALVGCIIGVAFSGDLSDRLGRKKLLFLSAVLFLFSAVGCALAGSLQWLITARLISGVGVGIASIVVPLYLSEIAPAAIRGRLVTCYQLAITVGILLAYITNSLLLNYSEQHALASISQMFDLVYIQEAWRGMFSIGIFIALLFLIGLFFVPESPRWLIKKGRNKEGYALLTKINNGKDRSAEVNAADTEAEEGGTYKELFTPKLRKALLLGVLLPLFSQLSGINAIIYYGPSILNDAGIALSNSFLGQIIFGVANLVFTFVAIWKVDQWGRRPLYLIGTVGATISLFLTALFFSLGQTSSIFLIISVTVFLACFAFSIGPLKFVVASEIFPTRIRGKAMGLSIMVMWVADTIVGQLTPVLLREAGTSVTFCVFGFFCLIAFITVYKLLPETKGKSLEEIESFWKNA
ncbi:sugar porter family MFS transporter [Pedobacter metabolipauper]|uniref:SP family arabinose:H+ symporter-like MFS transporter n=1 Tax=Pedobacter metabolipauper TaxID=425513 RepID=A0A4R6ST55_9SPHI|nr:sugar porter family MFS transporter [Pedobacter metabolipauper]TDQ08126.1 SP family arabinose:H+ symporter-like MFS transporter [Pedobacter metabolipauper]